MNIETFEPEDTVQFTFVSSVAPDAAPIFKVTGVAATVIASISSTLSDSTHYAVLYTLPTSEGYYLGDWFAQKTFSGSVYNFTKKFLFQNKTTRRIG